MTKVIIYDNIIIRKEVTKIFELEFYRKENGKIPVQDFLYSLNPKMEDYIRRAGL